MRTFLWQCLIFYRIHKSAPLQTHIFRTHCEGSGPLRLRDPFDAALRKQTNFSSLTWYFTPGLIYNISTHRIQVMLYDKKGITSSSCRYSVFETWGPKISNATANDTGIYSAWLITLNLVGLANISTKDTNIIVASPPTLWSAWLNISRLITTKGVKLTCGKVTNRGFPPIKLLWITPNKTLIHSLFDTISLGINITLQENEDAHSFMCQADFTSPAGLCIYEQNLWTAYYMHRLPSPHEDIDKSANYILLFAAIFVIALSLFYLVYMYVSKKANEAFESDGPYELDEPVEEDESPKSPVPPANSQSHGDQQREPAAEEAIETRLSPNLIKIVRLWTDWKLRAPDS